MPMDREQETYASSRRHFLAGVAITPFVAAPAAAVLASDPHAAREAEALALYRRHRETDWGWSEPAASSANTAANEAHHALMDFAKEAADMPPPTTLSGLRVLALTAALANEEFVDADDGDWDETVLRSLIEAIVAVTGATLPPDYRGLVYMAEGGLAASPPIALAAIAAEPHLDADLLAIEPEYMRLAAGELAAVDRELKAEGRVWELARSRAPGAEAGDRWYDALDTARTEVGYETFEEATAEARDAFFDLAAKVAAMRATTLDGLRAKGRMARHYPDMAASIAEDLRAMDAAAGGGV